MSHVPPSEVGTFAGWCFTLNNPPRTDLPKDWESVVMYCVWQLEKGEEGTPHLQGYVVFPRQVRFPFVKKLCKEANWQHRRGTHLDAKSYCSKQDTRVDGPFEYGKEPLGQGKRSDLDRVKVAIDAGKSEKELFDDYFPTMVKFYRGVREYKRLRTPVRSWKTEVHILWGVTNIGKSYLAWSEAPQAYPKRYTQGGGDWWDGYDSHEDVVIDEFYGWIKWNTLLQLLDCTPLLVDTKGGAVQFTARRIFITSNAHPRTWYNYRGHMEYRTLARRFTSVRTRESRETEWEFERLDVDLIPASSSDVTCARASTYNPPVITIDE